MSLFNRKYAKISIERDMALAFVDAVAPHDPDEALTSLIQCVIDERIWINEDGEWCVAFSREEMDGDEDEWDAYE